ncbi:MAG: T9SS type A sorting domain-containing protein [Candidatus Marinimicrobia bacterium]|nr:T9SS type A sorting domain-containing protein [Candidatus Neomarinimicrobiota bacterium]
MSIPKKLLSGFLFLQFAFATIINVPADQATIQGAIAIATAGDTVLVQAGTYVENIDFSGKDLVIMSASGPDITIIDGNQNGSVVLFITGETDNAVLDGFTITNGNGYTGSTAPRFGGGITCRIESSPTLRNLIVTNNTALGAGSVGGGIGCSVNSNPIIENVEISNNISYYGGGIAIYYSSPTIRNVVISDNTGNGSGGGLYAEASSPEISQVLIHGNSADQFGGGIWFHDNCNVILNAVTVIDNSCSIRGGGILCTGNVDLIVINSIAWGNTPGQIGTYTTGFTPNSITITHSDIEDGESGLLCDAGEAIWYGSNTDSNPLFVDQVNDDYHLADGSPCIDAGIAYFSQGDIIVDLAPEDYNGNAPDMGAFESQYTVDIDNEPALPNSFILHQNYPNPFNPITTIKYDLPRQSHVNITIYDLLGQTVKTILKQNQAAGSKTIQWDATNDQRQPVSAGVYICQIRVYDPNENGAGDFTKSGKMVLIK